MGNFLIDFPIVLVKSIFFFIELPLDCLYRLFRFLVPPGKKSIDNDIVLVTGAASGIGQLMAYKFSKQGARLIVCWDVNEKGNNETVTNIIQNGGQAIGLKCNLSVSDDVDAAAAKTKEMIKKHLKDNNATVTMLVNNAGIVTGRAFLKCKPELMKLTMDVNTTAHFWTLRNFLPDMLEKNNGHVVTIASGAGLGGVSGLVDYCASKYGAVGLSETLYMEMQKLKKNINITTICPYFISTGMFEGVQNAYPWLLPIIVPNDMADVIVDAVRQNKKFIVHPPILWLMYYLKPILGQRMYVRCCELLRVHESMDNFVGRVNK